MVDLANINFSDLWPSKNLISINKSLKEYHEYYSVWTPRFSEQLVAKQERHTAFDRYAIPATKSLPATIRPSIVKHLPLEISRSAHYLIIHEGQVLCNITDAHYWRSQLVQRSLEIPMNEH